MYIEEYQFGRINVEGEVYTDDVIISPDRVNGSWWREEGHEVSKTDLEPIWAEKPDILVIGTGARGVMQVLPETRKVMDRKCDKVHIVPTDKAVERYNELTEKEKGRRRVVAALHLTC